MGHNKPNITIEHIKQINQMIEDNPSWNRTFLSKKLCELWDWKSSVGQLKDISCRGLLRSLDKKGLIRLPAAKWTTRAPGIGADKIVCIDHDTTPVNTKLRDLMPIQVKIVSSSDDVRLFKSYIQQYHYLGFERGVGENIRYFVYSNTGIPLACLMFGSAAWKCYDRDKIIGWDEEQRRNGLTFCTNNVRFLILPWVRVDRLASHILGSVARRISGDWQTKYGHSLYMLETFVERHRFRGSAYKAANWRFVGITAGLGRNHSSKSGDVPLKDIYIYPLCCDFREKLNGLIT